jgi:TRAP-type C4-dicarboxylate transport system substrate-binding protein
MSPLNIVGSLDKLIYGLRLPYFFADAEEVDRAAYQGDMLEKINEATTKGGVRVLSLNHVGQATGIFNTKKPVKSVADMAGLSDARARREPDRALQGLGRIWHHRQLG